MKTILVVHFFVIVLSDMVRNKNFWYRKSEKNFGTESV